MVNGVFARFAAFAFQIDKLTGQFLVYRQLDSPGVDISLQLEIQIRLDLIGRVVCDPVLLKCGGYPGAGIAVTGNG